MTHIEEKLNLLNREMVTMFVLVLSQLKKAKQALLYLDKDLAREILSTEKRVNAQELKIDRDCENAIALYQPVAIDLRYVLALLKINNNLERTGDIAEGIAKFILDTQKPIDKELFEVAEVIEMFNQAIAMSEDIESAFTNEDTALARTIFKQDEILDEINRSANKRIAA